MPSTTTTLCRSALVPSQFHPWVCLRPAVDRPDGVGLVRVTCSFCGHEFEIEYAGLLGGVMFPVAPHEPQAATTGPHTSRSVLGVRR